MFRTCTNTSIVSISFPTACSYVIAAFASFMCRNMAVCLSSFTIIVNVWILQGHCVSFFVFSSCFSSLHSTLILPVQSSAWIHVWLTELQAVLSNGSTFVCSLRDNVGHLPWRLDIYLACWLRRNFFVTCPYTQNTVFLSCMCAFCINTARINEFGPFAPPCKWGLSAKRRSVEGGFPQCGLFCHLFIVQGFRGN